MFDAIQTLQLPNTNSCFLELSMHETNEINELQSIEQNDTFNYRILPSVQEMNKTLEHSSLVYRPYCVNRATFNEN